MCPLVYSAARENPCWRPRNAHGTARPLGAMNPHSSYALQVLGDFIGSMPELRRILNGLKDKGFKEGDYDIVRNNCNHFCDEFAFTLVGKRIPPWVNRAATVGTWAGLGEVRASV